MNLVSELKFTARASPLSRCPWAPWSRRETRLRLQGSRRLHTAVSSNANINKNPPEKKRKVKLSTGTIVVDGNIRNYRETSNYKK
jgi:hypothetical protein